MTGGYRFAFVVGIVALAAIAIGAMSSASSGIEDDLSSRVRSALSATGFDHITVDVEGRDVTLLPAEPLTGPEVALLREVAGVRGVRSVRVGPIPAPTTTTASTTTVPSQTTATSAVPATTVPAADSPASSVPVATTDASSDSGGLVTAEVTARVLDGQVSIGGTVFSDEQRTRVLEGARLAFGPDFEGDVRVVAPDDPGLVTVSNGPIERLVEALSVAAVVLVQGQIELREAALRITGVVADSSGEAQLRAVLQRAQSAGLLVELEVTQQSTTASTTS